MTDMDRIESLADHPPCLDCAHHRAHGSGCAVVEEGSRVPMDALAAREPCFLKEHLRRFAARYLSHRPRSLLDPDDLVHEVLARLLGDVSVRKGGFGRGLHAFLGYLRQIAVRSAITAERRERGRIRCGNCRHFGAYSGICLKEGHAWTHREVPAAGDPRRLDPACAHFSARRDGRHLEDEASLPDDDGGRFLDDRRLDVVEAVHKALLGLAQVHPRAALVVRARLLDGRTYEELEEIGASVRTMKRDFAFGVSYLRARLSEFDAGGAEEADFDPESVAREARESRFRRIGER